MSIVQSDRRPISAYSPDDLVVIAVADQSMPKVGDVIADKYTIEQLIGVGGMGAVFSAIHKFTGKRVALKWMLPELAHDEDAVQRFMREAHASGRINHPNVVDVYDVGQQEGAYFLVMEYLHGEPLTSALARRDMTPNEVLELLLPAMRGVAAAHRQGVVHRDLKPDNIFLAYEEDGVRRQPKVLDFGISKLSSDGTVDMRLTKTGAVVGTPYYMSPEQIRGLAGLDKRADVYSIGVILYEALTGRVPFHADTYGALVLEIATGTAQKPSDLVPGLPSGLSAIVLRAMAREADARYPDMESLIRALEPYALPQAIRSERRDSTGSGLRLEATRIAPPRIAPPRSESSGFGASLPRVTSTPFSAEIPEPARGFARLTGPVLFVVAAIAVVAGVWYMTREPAIAPSQAAAPPVPIETRPVPPPTAAAAVAPIAPTPSLVPPPSAASATPLPPATNSTPPPTAADGVSAPAAKPSPSAPARESNLDVSHAKATAHKRPVRNGSAKPASDPPDSPPSPATRARTPRSGTLNVDEF